MNRRDFLKGLSAAAAGAGVPKALQKEDDGLAADLAVEVAYWKEQYEQLETLQRPDALCAQAVYWREQYEQAVECCDRWRQGLWLAGQFDERGALCSSRLLAGTIRTDTIKPV